jgi:hypothetical protein
MLSFDCGRTLPSFDCVRTFQAMSCPRWEYGDSGQPFTIGYRLPGDPRPFGGLIDEVRIYDRALTLEEVQQSYAAMR